MTDRPLNWLWYFAFELGCACVAGFAVVEGLAWIISYPGNPLYWCLVLVGALLGTCLIIGMRWRLLAIRLARSNEVQNEANRKLLALLRLNKFTDVLLGLEVTRGGHMDTTRPTVMERTVEN